MGSLSLPALGRFASPAVEEHPKAARPDTQGLSGNPKGRVNKLLAYSQAARPRADNPRINNGEQTMMRSILLAALVIASFNAADTKEASAVVYCTYIGYPAGCVVRPGVVLRPRPVARAVVTPGVGAPGVGVRPGTPMNRGGPVNRAGRR